MKKDFVVGLTPYSQAERDRDERASKEADRRQFVRRTSCRSGANYNRRGTPAHKKLYARQAGERE